MPRIKAFQNIFLYAEIDFSVISIYIFHKNSVDTILNFLQWDMSKYLINNFICRDVHSAHG